MAWRMASRKRALGRVGAAMRETPDLFTPPAVEYRAPAVHELIARIERALAGR